jgi:O-antigen/teichoic acid export membrane protein
MLGVAFVSREFILITVGEKWTEVIPMLQLLCIYGSFYYLVNLYLSLLYSYGKSNVVMWYNIALSCVILAASVAMVGHDVLHIVIVYTSILMASIIGWHCLAHSLIGMRIIHLLKDMMPYLLITLSCFLIAWICTLAIQNIYLLLVLKMGIVAGLYFFISRYSGSVIFKESMQFIKPYNNKK